MGSKGQGDQSFRSQKHSFNQSRQSISIPTPTPSKKVDDALETCTDSLLLSLRILRRYDQAHKLKLTGISTRKGSGLAGIEHDFKFTRDMFLRNNTEALLQVTYQIFSTAFPDETSVKFRTCWPTSGDRKLESEYRRIAHPWVVEIAEAYPNCFETKPQVAFFVTPSGLKCVRFLACFAKCGLFILAERIQAAKNMPMIENPIFCDPALRMDNLRLIEDANEASSNKCIELLNQQAKYLVFTDKMKSEELEDRLEVTKSIEDQEQRLEKLIQSRPELFPADAVSLLHSVSRFIVPDGRELAEALLAVDSNNSTVEDKLRYNLKEEWKQKLMLLRDTYGTVAGFLAQNESLIQLLDQIRTNHSLAIDIKNYPNLFKLHQPDQLESAADCMQEIPERFQFIQKLLPTLKEPRDLTSLTSNLMKKVNEAKNFLANEGNKFESRTNKDDLLFLIKVEEIALENTDWNKFLPSTSGHLTDLSLALNLTPVKPRDFIRTTGLTPNFDYGIDSRVSPESKVRRLMNAIRVSSTPAVPEHSRILALKGTSGVSGKQYLSGKAGSMLEDIYCTVKQEQQELSDEDESSTLCQVSEECLPGFSTNVSEGQREIGIMEKSAYLSSFDASGISLDL